MLYGCRARITGPLGIGTYLAFTNNSMAKSYMVGKSIGRESDYHLKAYVEPYSIERETATLPPRGYISLAKNAIILMRAREYDKAMILLNRILSQDSHNHFALAKMGECTLATKRFPLAINCYQKLVSVCGQKKYKLHLANALYGARQNDLAREIYLEMKNDLCGENLYVASKNLGHIYAQEKNFIKAQKYYEEALNLHPHSGELRIGYGVLEMQSKAEERGFDKALSWFRSVVEWNSDSDVAWVGLAIVHNEYGDLEIAWGNLERALDVNPVNEVALRLYLEWGLRNHKLSAIVDRYKEALRQKPDLDILKIQLTKIQFCLGH